MTITASTTRRGLHFVAINDQRVGMIENLGITYRAVRKNGAVGDIRKVSQGFRTIEAAAAWIAKATTNPAPAFA